MPDEYPRNHSGSRPIRALPSMTKYRSILSIAFIVGAILIVAVSVRLGLANLGMLAYRKAVIPVVNGPVSDFYVHGGMLADDPNAEAAVTYLTAAQELGQSAAGQWALARSEMVIGKIESAAGILQDLRKKQPANPLLYQDTLLALSRTKRFQDIASLFEGAPPLYQTLTISDSVAEAYLEVAQRSDNASAQELMKRAHKLRPGDLFLNEYFWRQPRDNSQRNSGDEYRLALTTFPISAINPVNDQLVQFVVDVLPRLRQEGIWEKDQLVRAVADLSWRYSYQPELKDLLRGLAAEYPQEPEWQFYLGEVYQRDGDIQRAQTAYGAALQIDPDHAASLYRSGLLYELSGKWVEAQDAYQKYQRLVPDDLAGLEALVRLSDKLAAPNSGVLRQQLNSVLDDIQTAARLLPSSTDAIEVGPNVVINPGYEDEHNGVLADWAIGDYLNGQNGTAPQGAFASGADSAEKFEGQYSARIDGLWRTRDLTGSYGLVSLPENPRGSYWIQLETNQPYLVSGLYKTNGVSATGQVYVGNSGTSLLSMALPGTNGAWHKYAWMGCTQSESPEWMQLVLQLVTPGQIWFDQIKIQPLLSQNQPVSCKRTSDGNK